MGKEVEKQFEDCLKSGKIKKFSGANDLIRKELNVAKGDFEAARDGLEEKRWKWSTIQAYFATARSFDAQRITPTGGFS